MLPTAQSHIAGERKRSRWSKARLSLLVPIGAIVAVAIVCVVVAVLTSARRADEVSAAREQSLLETAIAGKGMRLIRELDSAAATERATSYIRNAYDSQWVSRRAQWLVDYYNEDIVVIVDGNDRIKYTLFRAPADAASVDLGAQIASTLDLLRGQLNAVPEHAVAVIAKQDPAKPGRHTALIQRFMDRPAIVGAVAVGTETDLAAGNAHAPIAVAVRYIDAAMLKEIGERLQLTNLRKIDEPAPPAGEHAVEFADAQGNAIARFAWEPTRPGGKILGSVLPFIAVALGGFALLVGLVLRYMRRSAEEIRAGESQLRHLALHDPICGLPNRIYFGERLESVIGEQFRKKEQAVIDANVGLARVGYDYATQNF